MTRIDTYGSSTLFDIHSFPLCSSMTSSIQRRPFEVVLSGISENTLSWLSKQKEWSSIRRNVVVETLKLWNQNNTCQILSASTFVRRGMWGLHCSLHAASPLLRFGSCWHRSLHHPPRPDLNHKQWAQKMCDEDQRQGIIAENSQCPEGFSMVLICFNNLVHFRAAFCEWRDFYDFSIFSKVWRTPNAEAPSEPPRRSSEMRSPTSRSSRLCASNTVRFVRQASPFFKAKLRMFNKVYTNQRSLV